MKTIEKIRQAYDKWIGDKPTPEEVKFAEDCCDHIVGIGFIGGWNTRDKEVKAEEKEKSKAVKEIVMYLFDDELRDYSENPSDNHIFLKLMKLKEMFGIEIENMCMSCSHCSSTHTWCNLKDKEVDFNESCESWDPVWKQVKEIKRRVRCNHCMSVFDEEYLKDIIDAQGNEAERCPVCSKGDALMDI